MRRTQAMAMGMPGGLAEFVAGKPQSIVMAGSSAADATKITESVVLITTSDAGGAILPASSPGDTYFIKNEGGATCTLYPPTGATINTTTSLSVATAKSAVVFFTSSTACHSIPTVAS